MTRWERRYLYGIIPVDVEVEIPQSEVRREARSTVRWLLALILIIIIIDLVASCGSL